MQHRYSLAILCAFTLTLALTVDSSNVITSPETCLRTADCPSHQFCDTEGEKNRYRCKALRPEGAPCRDGVCAHGLYCPQADKGRRCTPKLAINALCEQPSGSFSYLEVDDPCAGADARCVYGRDNKYRCRRDFGKEGDLCLGDVDCNVAQGLVCPSNRCEPRSPVGSYCDHTHPLTYCVGFCALYGTDHAGYEGTCARAPAPGMPCRLHNECQGYDPPAQSGRFLLLCNFIRNRRGLCARAADLLKTLGAPCNPRHDLCDAERGLSCRWWHAKRRFVCQQAASDRDTPIYYKQDNRFCDPTKPSLSRCFPFNGLPMTCRPATSPRHNGFYHCARPVERVPIGAPCNENFAACPKSAVCATVPGVRTVPGVYTGPRSTDTSHKACRRVVSAGMSCANKFTTMCKGSLVCVRGKCRMPAQTPNSGGSNGSTNNTHSGLTVSCGPKSLPCVPGTVCDVSNESMQRRCLLPKQVVGLGQVCFSSARIRRTCASGLVCVRSKVGTGVLTCQKPREVGDVCESVESCAEGLGCSAVSDVSPFLRNCFNKTITTLTLGNKCDPRLGAKKQCRSFVDQGRLAHTVVVRSRCLPTSNGTFTCQRTAVLHEQCAPDENTGCIGDNTVCSDYGVCIPNTTKRE